MSLFTHHDYFHIHKILGFGCLFNYSYRFYLKAVYDDMNLDNGFNKIIPLIHLGLSLSSFIFKVPIQRFINKTIIWKELQLHNIIFTSRSVFIIYHSIFFKNINVYYYLTKLGIILSHHYLADLVSNKYINNDLTTTRDITYDNKNEILIKLNRKFYAISQLIATSGLLLATKSDFGFMIMFPIQLSTFLMTLVRKGLISNNSWHLYYSLSLILPYLVSFHHFTKLKNNDINLFTILFIISRLELKINKYLNMILLSSSYIIYKFKIKS